MRHLSISILLTLLSANCLAGGNIKGNGGFLYSSTSEKLLFEAQYKLLSELKFISDAQRDLSYRSKFCLKPIDLERVLYQVVFLESSFDEASIGINPNGKKEKRYFHHNKNGNVEATQLFFESFVDTSFRYKEASDDAQKNKILSYVRLPILHEILHEFDYDEQEALNCRDDLSDFLENYKVYRPDFLDFFEEAIHSIYLEKAKKMIKKYCEDAMTQAFNCSQKTMEGIQGSVSCTRSAELYSCLASNNLLFDHQENTQSSVEFALYFASLDDPEKLFNKFTEYLDVCHVTIDVKD